MQLSGVNFHMPLSTMLMMVSAFGGYDVVMKAYDAAVMRNTVLARMAMPC